MISSPSDHIAHGTGRERKKRMYDIYLNCNISIAIKLEFLHGAAFLVSNKKKAIKEINKIETQIPTK